MNSNRSDQPHLQKIAPFRVFEQAVEQIRELISAGTWVPGQRLPTEQDLSIQLNVSRSSVREALRVLEAEGLVEVKRGSGTYVCEPRANRRMGSDLARWLEQREETIEQVLQVRESIEGLSASLAANHATNNEIEDIQAILTNQITKVNELVDENERIKELAILDAAFHIAISTASGNDIAEEIISHILPAFNESNKAVLYLSRRAPRMIKEHGEIMAALKARDSAAAEKAMREHIRRVREEIVTLKKSEGDR